MRFRRKNKFSKTILVISDIHLGAGAYINGKRNFLEDFHFDKELVEFFEFFSSGEYLNREVELIINGDFFDLLAVPFVKFYDDEFWSEEAALEKLKLIYNGHPEVMKAMDEFLKVKKKSIVYIIGNHDAEMVLPKLKDYFLKSFSQESQKNVSIFTDNEGIYIPTEGVHIKHGHEYEVAHSFPLNDSVIENKDGNKYFLPPWGSYFVTRVMNKFKAERDYINAVRPIKKFIINGLIYDPLLIIRFLLTIAYYFIMVRFISLFKRGESIKDVFMKSIQELELFQDFEQLTTQYFVSNPQVKTLIVGHTHEPIFKIREDGNIFINTGTWTKMYNMDFDKSSEGLSLTYAQIDIPVNSDYEVALNSWKGTNRLPYREFR